MSGFFLFDLIMIDFLKGSETFNAITFQGCYGMSLRTFEKLYEHYIITGENTLDDYSNVTYMTWEIDEIGDSLIDGDEYNRKMESISKMRSIGLFDPDELCHLRSEIRRGYKNYTRWKKYNSSKEVQRRNASKYTSKRKIRKAVFDLHGKKCLCCGAIKNIQLDHIKPVYEGGKNEINNLQPLCKTCNVSKGTKTIDYRENAQHLTV